ncbi:hypothetical protein AB6A40_006408 [Gnathostoma spinigerum]|uniref:Uncharacterized protein n=1 Tax=Gnathostoma spinigerum TaxID=75299 RepID=A0ABD6EQY8_9BILA
MKKPMQKIIKFRSGSTRFSKSVRSFQELQSAVPRSSKDNNSVWHHITMREQNRQATTGARVCAPPYMLCSTTSVRRRLCDVRSNGAKTLELSGY